MSDDTSILKNAQCSDMIHGSGGSVANHMIYTMQQSHVNLLSNRIECDDYLGAFGGEFWFYVR